MTPKHTNAIGPCPSCEQKLLQAHPLVVEWFNTVVKPAHQDAHISCTWRNKQDQELAFLNGASQLHWPLSDHNKTDDQGNPCALAVDLFELDFNSVARLSWKFFKTIADETEKSTFKIKWGGYYKTLGDAAHFGIDISGVTQ